MRDVDDFLSDADDVIADWEASDDAAAWAADGSHENDPIGTMYAPLSGGNGGWDAGDFIGMLARALDTGILYGGAERTSREVSSPEAAADEVEVGTLVAGPQMIYGVADEVGTFVDFFNETLRAALARTESMYESAVPMGVPEAGGAAWGGWVTPQTFLMGPGVVIFGMSPADPDAPARCPVWWGSHACHLPVGHDGAGHECSCCTCTDHVAENPDGGPCVGAPPYYGPDTVLHDD